MIADSDFPQPGHSFVSKYGGERRLSPSVNDAKTRAVVLFDGVPGNWNDLHPCVRRDLIVMFIRHEG